MPNYVAEITTPVPVDIHKYVDLENVTLNAKYPQKPNWLLIGGIALAIILLFKKR